MSLEILNNPLIGNSFNKVLGGNSPNSESINNKSFFTNSSKTSTTKDYSTEITNILDWETDEYINLELLIVKIKSSNRGLHDYQFPYNPKDLKTSFSQKSIKFGKDGFIRLKVYRNPKVGNVSIKWNDVRVVQKIDLNKKKIFYRLYFYYANTNETAFILETIHYKEFKNLNILLNYGDIDKYEADYNYFLQNFANILKNESDANRLKFLYENIPDSIITNLNSFLDDSIIFNHLLNLTDLDDSSGIFSGWKDGSSAIVNILKCLDNIYLINKFKTDPHLCNRIYYNLDDASDLDGEIIPNKIIFATILMQYCIRSHNRPKEDAPTFRIGKKSEIATNVTELGGDFLTFGKSDESSFFLQQKTEYFIEDSDTITDDFGVTFTVLKKMTDTVDPGALYFPMEMVYFIDENAPLINEETGEKFDIPIPVPAIYVKALADAEKMEDIAFTIRIIADIVGVILGIGTLILTGNPYIAVAAAGDLFLSGMDLTVQIFRKEIAKLDGGEQFLKDWDVIYNKGGVILAAPQLIFSLYKGLLFLFVKASEKVKQGLQAVAISVFIELHPGAFQRKDLRLFQPTEWVIPSAGFFKSSKECEALMHQGAFFMELDAASIMESINKGNGINPNTIGNVNSNQKFALIYKGEILAQGNRYDKDYQKVLQDIKKVSNSSEKVSEALEKLWKRIPKLTENKFHWTCINESGTELRWANVTEKDIQKSLNSALGSSNGGKLWEAEVARELSQYDKIADFGNIYEQMSNGKKVNNAGDIDVGSSKYIIECKESVSKNIKAKDFFEQFDKYLNPKNEKYINIKNRKPVLAIKSFKDNAINISHPVFKELQKRGVIIITDLNQIKNLK